MPRPWTVLPAAALCAVLVLSGCTDDPEPRFADPTVEATPTEAPTPTSQPPATAPTTGAVEEPERLTPEETVRAWVAARNELLKTGNPEAVSDLSSSACTSCDDLTRSIVQLYERGGWIRSEGWKVESLRERPDFQASMRIQTAMAFSPGTRKESSEDPPRRYGIERNFIDFLMTRQAGRWLVAQVVFLT